MRTGLPERSSRIATNRRNHAAFSIGGSNFGEVSGGQCKRLLNNGFPLEQPPLRADVTVEADRIMIIETAKHDLIRSFDGLMGRLHAT